MRTRKNFCLYTFFFIMGFLLLLLFPGGGYAEKADPEMGGGGTAFIDRSSDQLAYGEQVALLNRQAENPARTGAKSRGENQAGLAAVLTRSDGREIDFSPWEPRYAVAGPHHCYTLYFDSGEAADRATEELKRLPGIRYAERDAVVNACDESGYSFSSWGAEAMNFGSYLDYSLQWGSGSCTIAIVDSGIFLHSRLKDRIRASGYDYVDGDWDATNDLFGHGTNVAGIAADCTAGEPVYFYPIRVLNANGGGSISNVANAVREATEQGVEVINLSLESTVLSVALDEAILDAVRAGITVVAAAGNRSMDTSQVSPAHLQNAGVIVVGAVERNGSRADYSNYGESVDVYAYGTGIVCCSRNGGYTTATGTSMAAPHVSGLAAMLRLIHPGLSPGNIEARIEAAADGASEIRVPDLLRMIPERYGLRLTQLKLDPDNPLQLPQTALPETAMENITYQSSDETVLRIEAGRLIPVQAGTVTVTASCTGFEAECFDVQVGTRNGMRLTVPPGVQCIGDEAFRGDGAIECVVMEEGVRKIGDNVFEECGQLETVFLPDSLTDIGSNTFSGAVIVCSEGSGADWFAQENNLDYVIEKR